MSDDEIPTPEPEDEAAPDTEVAPARTREEFDAMTERLWLFAQAQKGLIQQLHERLTALEADDKPDSERLARWLTFPPPPAAEDARYCDETPLFTIANFVHYYNEVYVGKPGTRAVAIPDCWLDHPGLLAELATLTYTWRAAHIGKNAAVKDAQYWHDRWRPAFAERLVTEWTHAHCLTNIHRPAGASSVRDRYTAERAESAPDIASPAATVSEHEAGESGSTASWTQQPS